MKATDWYMILDIIFEPIIVSVPKTFIKYYLQACISYYKSKKIT